MNINKENFEKAFECIDEKFKNYELPAWEQLPDIELYMDQVVSLLEKYLKEFHEVIGNDKTVTPSMINNYVKLGTIPPPVKKRYTKIHLAYLIIVCILKQTLDMATIQKLVPVTDNEAAIIRTYNAFSQNLRKSLNYTTESIHSVADPTLKDGSDISDIIMQISITANIFKILTEAITKAQENKKPSA